MRAIYNRETIAEYHSGCAGICLSPVHTGGPGLSTLGRGFFADEKQNQDSSNAISGLDLL